MVCDTSVVRHSDFWDLMNAEFGSAYAGSLARDYSLGALGGRTPEQALDHGMAPRQVWVAICADFDIPPHRHFGPEKRPPRA